MKKTLAIISKATQHVHAVTPGTPHTRLYAAVVQLVLTSCPVVLYVKLKQIKAKIETGQISNINFRCNISIGINMKA